MGGNDAVCRGCLCKVGNSGRCGGYGVRKRGRSAGVKRRNRTNRARKKNKFRRREVGAFRDDGGGLGEVRGKGRGEQRGGCDWVTPRYV